jgi:hypothetical protein
LKKQSQFQNGQIGVSYYVKGYYGYKMAFRAQKNKPNQSQFRSPNYPQRSRIEAGQQSIARRYSIILSVFCNLQEKSASGILCIRNNRQKSLTTQKFKKMGAGGKRQ